MKRILAFLSIVLLAAAFQVQAANWHVSISNGKNKNPGTPGAPLKNIWKAIEKAKPGDMILIAEGNYPGKMSCGWINLDKPVSLIGGYSPDFSARDVLKYRTMLRPTNAQNTTKPTHGTLTINTRKFGPNSNILIDGIIFDHTAANSYHPVKGKPAGFKDGMLTIPPAKGNTQYPSIDKYLIYAQTDGQLVIQNCLFLNGCSYAIIVAQYSGNVRILNNVFIGNRMMGADVRTTNGKPFTLNYEFANNTVLFTWTRTKAFEDMGYGVRTNPGVFTNIHHNILGLNCMAGLRQYKGRCETEKSQTRQQHLLSQQKSGRCNHHQPEH